MADAAPKDHLPTLRPNSLPSFVKSSITPPRTLEEMRAKAVLVMGSEKPLISAAMDLAGELVGLWPSYGDKAASQSTIYLSGLASALAHYPALIAQECCDPRVGLARVDEREPTVKAVHDWCEARLKLYRGMMPRSKAVTHV